MDFGACGGASGGGVGWLVALTFDKQNWDGVRSILLRSKIKECFEYLKNFMYWSFELGNEQFEPPPRHFYHITQIYKLCRNFWSMQV